MLKFKVVFNIAMSETNTPMRITRGTYYPDNCIVGIPLFDLCITQMQSQISGSITAMEIEKKSKFLNIPITLNLNDELVRLGSSKRKEGSIMKVDETKIDKRRKVKHVVSGMIGNHCTVIRTRKHIDVVLYYLCKKSKYNINSRYRYTTVDCLFNSKIAEIYATYAQVGSGICVANVESDIHDYINGYRREMKKTEGTYFLFLNLSES
ncbi:hypothetical protein H5410_048803 [Solanum commersonii]|uniref:Uncharacterized protein n=1 Tax=Solanum commersonii TaxID=4109 RepID=A0A9J5XJ75_SOLCO|nr:hypothetical protein H5410_048803 [Solanum commersonii]